METVLHAASMYLLLMMVFKIAGRRTLMEMTAFNLILLLIIEEGKPLHQRAKRSSIDEEDILQSARNKQGLERLDQIKSIILEDDRQDIYYSPKSKESTWLSGLMPTPALTSLNKCSTARRTVPKRR